ncbi:MAG TPA: NADH-quinone oxidoreductase subunit C [Actinomycetota bacterium]|nr:NADH-quinone oxidoreductase subunit C [Actinomycetota bacterium]
MAAHRLESVASLVSESFPEAVTRAYEHVGEAVLIVARDHLVPVMTALRDRAGFEMLCDLSGVDWLPREPRFEVNYHLYSFAHNDRLRVKVQLPDGDPVLPSVVQVWPGADWQEREVWDMYGVTFTGHPNLVRILMPDEWEGHPLRKDYPVGGVPVEYRIEPAYVGADAIPDLGRASMGGAPPRLVRDRGRLSPWTWTGPPATGVRAEPDPPKLPPDTPQIPSGTEGPDTATAAGGDEPK